MDDTSDNLVQKPIRNKYASTRQCTVALVGQPNVGKSVILNSLTGADAVVSNYPGTTVEVTRGSLALPLGGRATVIDTPGVYSLQSGTDEQAVTQRILAEEKIDLIVDVCDACNLERSLRLTLELLGLGIPLVVVVNQMDMAEEAGISVDVSKLASSLQIRSMSMIALRGEGITELRSLIDEQLPAADRIAPTSGNARTLPCGRSRRCSTCPDNSAAARQLASGVVSRRANTPVSPRAKLERLVDSPLTGIPLLSLTVWAAFRLVVTFMTLAENMMESALAPVITGFARLTLSLARYPLLKTILAAVPDGLVLPLSVVMPAMIAIYLTMAVLEDTGLLPRIAITTDRLMSSIGLPGQAVIPIVLGFGCKAPAILGTRALPGKRERFIATCLLAITVPCAASLGIITGVGQSFGASLPIIYGTMATVFVLLGMAMGRSGRSADREMVLEIPPLRWPAAPNIMAKLRMRFAGFFTHVLPLLVVTSVAVRVLVETGVLSFVTRLSPLTSRIFGISGEAMAAVLVSIVQRYMAPMVLLNLPLSAREATIAGSMVSVSLPCLPVALLIGRELGWTSLAKIVALAAGLSLLTGSVLNAVLPAF
ncbi:MAG: FeoB small GTPase domain-containing protein [Bacillota bacterium]